MSEDSIPTRSVAARLIRQAARGAPVALAERLEEEWLADLAAQPSAFARLRFALGCCWATHVIAREQRAVRVRIANPETLPLDPLRSRSMTRFRPLWIAAAALVVTALVIVTAGVVAKFLYSWALSHARYIAGTEPSLWVMLPSLIPIFYAVGAGIYHMKHHPGARIQVPRHRGSFWMGVLVMSACSALLLAASVYCLFAPHFALEDSVRKAMALFFAITGIGLPLATYFTLLTQSPLSGPGLPGARWH